MGVDPMIDDGDGTCERSCSEEGYEVMLEEELGRGLLEGLEFAR
jgi:hypothetical protein